MIVISVDPERVERGRERWGEFRVFTPSRTAETKRESIKLAYQDLSDLALLEGWDESVTVLQDDFYLIGDAPRGQITSFHRARADHVTPRGRRFHCCPRAFAATLEGWRLLAETWTRDGQICELWRPDVIHHLARPV